MDSPTKPSKLRQPSPHQSEGSSVSLVSSLVAELDHRLPAVTSKPAQSTSKADRFTNDDGVREPEIENERLFPSSVVVLDEVEQNAILASTALDFRRNYEENPSVAVNRGRDSGARSPVDSEEENADTDYDDDGGIEATMSSMTCASSLTQCGALSFDERKRPLSVASTTSSSSSSLPRRYRKKLAVNVLISGYGGEISTAESTDSHQQHPTSLSTVVECSPSDWRLLSGNGETTTRFRFAAATETGHVIGDSKTTAMPLAAGGSARTRSPDVVASCDASVIDSIDTSMESDNHVAMATTTTGSNPSDVRKEFYIVRRVIEEIIETERSYVRDLGEVVHGYAHTMRTSAERLHLAANDVDILFGNIEEIYAFNRNFLSMLELCGNNNPAGVARCFVSQTDGFVIYSDYCSNYPRAITMLTSYMQNDVIAATLKHQQMALQHVLPLGSYLLKPVQRILKYHLLLQRMSQHTQLGQLPQLAHHHQQPSDGGSLDDDDDDGSDGIPGHVGTPSSDSTMARWCSADDQDAIQAAVTCMMGVAARVNEMKAGHRSHVRVQELQSELSGWYESDLTTYGPIIIEDKFRLSGARAWRHVVLFQRAILIAKKRRVDSTMAVKTLIQCSDLMLIESVPKEPLSFQVIRFDSPRDQYKIQARNIDQKRLWCQHLKKMILDNYNAVIPDKAKELVMMLGSRSDEDGTELCPSSPDPNGKHQHQVQPLQQGVVPQYIDRWRSRRKSAGIVQDLKQKSKKGSHSNGMSDTCSSPVSPQPSPQPRRKSDVTDLLLGAYKLMSNRSKSSSIDTVVSGSISQAASAASLSNSDHDGKTVNGSVNIQSSRSTPPQQQQLRPCDVIIEPSACVVSGRSTERSDSGFDETDPMSPSTTTRLELSDDDVLREHDEYDDAAPKGNKEGDLHGGWQPGAATTPRQSIPDILIQPPPVEEYDEQQSTIGAGNKVKVEEAEAEEQDIATGGFGVRLPTILSALNDACRRDSVALAKAKRATMALNGLGRVGAGRMRRDNSPLPSAILPEISKSALHIYEIVNSEGSARNCPSSENLTRRDNDTSCLTDGNRGRNESKFYIGDHESGSKNGRQRCRQPIGGFEGVVSAEYHKDNSFVSGGSEADDAAVYGRFPASMAGELGIVLQVDVDDATSNRKQIATNDMVVDGDPWQRQSQLSPLPYVSRLHRSYNRINSTPLPLRYPATDLRRGRPLVTVRRPLRGDGTRPISTTLPPVGRPKSSTSTYDLRRHSDDDDRSRSQLFLDDHGGHMWTTSTLPISRNVGRRGFVGNRSKSIDADDVLTTMDHQKFTDERLVSSTSTDDGRPPRYPLRNGSCHLSPRSTSTLTSPPCVADHMEQLGRFGSDLAKEILDELMKQTADYSPIDALLPLSPAACSAARTATPSGESTSRLARARMQDAGSSDNIVGSSAEMISNESGHVMSTPTLPGLTENVAWSAQQTVPTKCGSHGFSQDSRVDAGDVLAAVVDTGLTSPDRIVDALKSMFAQFISKLRKDSKEYDADKKAEVLSGIPSSGSRYVGNSNATYDVARHRRLFEQMCQLDDNIVNAKSRSASVSAPTTQAAVPGFGERSLLRERSEVIGERMATPDPPLASPGDGEMSVLERALTIIQRRRRTAGDQSGDNLLRTTVEEATKPEPEMPPPTTSRTPINLRRSNTFFYRRNVTDSSSPSSECSSTTLPRRPLSCSCSSPSFDSLTPNMASPTTLDVDSDGSSWSLSLSTSSSSSNQSRSSFYENKLTEDLERPESQRQLLTPCDVTRSAENDERDLKRCDGAVPETPSVLPPTRRQISAEGGDNRVWRTGQSSVSVIGAKVLMACGRRTHQKLDCFLSEEE